MKLSIRSKLIFSFLIILVLAVGLIGITFTLNDQFIRSQQVTILDTKAKSATKSLLDYFLTIRQQQQNIANAFASGGEQGLALAVEEAQTTLSKSPSVQKVTILNPSNRELAKITKNKVADPSQLGIELPSEDFNTALSTDIAVSKAFFSPESISPQVYIYTPAINSTGQVLAVIKSQVQLNLLPEVLSSLDLGESGVAYVIDTEGLVVSHPNAGKVDSQKILSRPIIDKLINAGYIAIEAEDNYYKNENNVDVIARGNIIEELGWVLIVEQPTSVVFAPLSATRTILLGSLAAAIILMIAITLVISSSLARPIRQLTKRAQQLENGDFKAKADIQTGDELEVLSNSFNSMTEQLSERQRSLELANKTLTAERDRQEVLLQSLTDGVLAVDSKNSVILFNKAAESITGMRAESIIGRNINAALQFYYHNKLLPLEQYSVQSPQNKRKLKEEGLVINTDRGQLFLSMSVDPIRLGQDGKNGWIITLSDMTKEKEFEIMKLDFVSMAAHELRTPLTAMRGYLSLLGEEAGNKLTKDEKQYLDRTFISANQLNSLVENLLNLSRVERGALKLSLAPMEIDSIITAAVDNLSGIANQKNISLTFSPDKEPTMVLADHFRIAEVITNLVGNAINYTAAGGKVEIVIDVDKTKATVSVIDTGQGIPASAVSHLFTKFYRVQSSLAMGSKGTGLGLYISKAIIDAHRGKIWVESVEGKGSTFSFTLPLVQKKSKAQAKSSAK